MSLPTAQEVPVKEVYVVSKWRPGIQEVFEVSSYRPGIVQFRKASQWRPGIEEVYVNPIRRPDLKEVFFVQNSSAYQPTFQPSKRRGSDTDDAWTQVGLLLLGGLGGGAVSCALATSLGDSGANTFAVVFLFIVLLLLLAKRMQK